MNNIKSNEEKLVFSDRLERVHKEILKRLQPRREREGTRSSPVGTDGKDPLTEVFVENPGAPYVINLANAIVRSWLVTPVVIFRDEALVGITRPMYPNIEHFSWGIRPSALIAKCETLQGEEKEKCAALIKRMQPLDRSHVEEEAIRRIGKDRWNVIVKDDMLRAGGFQGHTISNYPTLLSKGLDGMLAYIDECAAKNAKDQETADFYEANRIIVRGMSQWLEAYSAKARNLAAAEMDSQQKQWYVQIAENCAFVAHNKPVTLYQAAQLMWTLSLWDWVDSVGRCDQYLWPYYVYSRDNGDVVSTEEVITSVVFKIWENGVHNLTLGGVKPADGSDATNDISYLFLQVLRTLHATHPRMSIRIHEKMEPELLDLAVKMWQEGLSDPTIVSDPTVIKGLTAIGVPLEDARDYSELGCQEIEIPGKSNFGCEDGTFNLAKVLEYTLHDGYSPNFPDVRVGLATGKFETFETFEEFYAAYMEQVKFFNDLFIALCNKGQEIRYKNHAKLVKGVFTTGCLEKGKPHDGGGPLYNFGVVETAGLTVASDSLTAIKKLVFDEKKIAKETLIKALDSNFVGYEKERQLLLNFAPKFGNDNDEADVMAKRLLEEYWDLVATYTSVRGGAFTGACSILSRGIDMGKRTGAMPDGRLAGEPYGNSMGPRPGADKSGLTAMLNSVTKLPLHKGVGGTTLNVVLTTKLLSNAAVRSNVAATLKAYALSGGQMAQITTANLEDLLDAKVHPERHGDLIVRIGGYSAEFIELNAAIQDEIISRYESA